MYTLNVIFIVLTVITAILMIGIVLVQKSKGGGLSSSFGGGNQVLGVRGTNKFLEKGTWILAALILVFSVCSAYTLPKAGSDIRAQKVAPQQTPKQEVPVATDNAAAPAAPAATEQTAAPAEAAPAPAEQATDAAPATPVPAEQAPAAAEPTEAQ